MKNYFNCVSQNSVWIIGDGSSVNFWNDSWCGEPISDVFNFPDWMKKNLKAPVKDFIRKRHRFLLKSLKLAIPNLINIVEKVHIPLDVSKDERAWKLADCGVLNLKLAYEFHAPPTQLFNWGKLIWNNVVPPFKSFLIWRLFHNRLPTDDNLKTRGMNGPSVCNLCFKEAESSQHLMFDCCYAHNIWSWLSNTLDCHSVVSSLDEMYDLMNKQASPQCKIVTLSAVISSVNTIWFARNQIRFNNKVIHWRSSIARIMADANLSGNSTSKLSSSAISDFVILKAFNVNIHPPKPPSLMEVIWQPPIFDWIKCNCDGAAIGLSGSTGCGGIFRNNYADHFGSFVVKVDNYNSLKAELTGAITAIKIAHENNWRKIWLETDFKLVVQAFSSKSLTVPWQIRQRWYHCL